MLGAFATIFIENVAIQNSHDGSFRFRTKSSSAISKSQPCMKPNHSVFSYATATPANKPPRVPLFLEQSVEVVCRERDNAKHQSHSYGGANTHFLSPERTVSADLIRR